MFFSNGIDTRHKNAAVLHKELESSSDSSVRCYHWPGVATWWMVVGGVSDAGTNGVEEGRLGEPSLPMKWMLGVSMDSRFKLAGFRKDIQWR
ncbi:hypothetical protein TNCV_2941221 [Trichonephila clavipes]|nr:hypothetical protein TNCV_2941221 [Trichonephila clavipes]